MEYLRDQSAVEESATLLVAWLDLLTGMASGEEGARNVFESLLTSNAGKHQPLLILTHEPGRNFLVSIKSTALYLFPIHRRKGKDNTLRERDYVSQGQSGLPPWEAPIMIHEKTYFLLSSLCREDGMFLLPWQCAPYSKAICSKS